ncbi:DUF58 domain-containing protein [Paenibacillus thailandensis]|uniref:DUF58 domain-containing protein n=1 Tax=Paenibacillus thailandensis TaxID=393250 RepID=A0ABW5QSF4_9BACL
MGNARREKVRWQLVAAVYAASLLYVLFQGGKTSLMLFMILNLLLAYLLVGRWSGISGVKGARSFVSANASVGAEHALSSGHSVEVSLQVKIPGVYPIPYVLVRDVLIRHDGQKHEFEASFVPSWKREGEVSYRTPALPRGEYRFGRTLCSTYDVFGLFEHTGEFEAEAGFSVLPATVPVRRWHGIQRGARGVYSHAAAPRSSKETTQINGVREYLHGDRLSRVHWNATAKTGDWKSKEFERESLPRTMIVLDRSRSAYAGGKEEAFELAVSVAASLMESGHRSDTAIGLLSAGEKTVVLPPKQGIDQRSAVMKHLTSADMDGGGNLSAALQSSEGLLPAGMFVVLVTADSGKNALSCMEWLQKRGMSPCLLHIAPGRGTGETAADRQLYQLMRGRGWPVVAVSQLQELPSLLEGGGAA